MVEVREKWTAGGAFISPSPIARFTSTDADWSGYDGKCIANANVSASADSCITCLNSSQRIVVALQTVVSEGKPTKRISRMTLRLNSKKR
jgi:hypothetical protein